MRDAMPDHDPFADPLPAQEDGPSSNDLTLTVRRDVSLTIATNLLIVVDEDVGRKRSPSCFGLLSGRTSSTSTISLHNVLWAVISDHHLTITYAKSVGKGRVRPESLYYFLDKPEDNKTEAWVTELLNRAYGKAPRRRKVKVLINPFGGQGNAQKLYVRDIEPIFAAARYDVDVEKTAFRGHAVEIAEKVDTEAYDLVACCSGDGVPHEVFNGLGRRSDATEALSKIAIVQLPCGSGNAMSLNLNGTDSPSLAALAVVKGLETPLDLTSIIQGNSRMLSFLSQAVGIVAEVDLGTENLRWMGSFRFTYGFFVRIMRKTIYPCELSVKIDHSSKSEVRSFYQRETAKSVQSGLNEQEVDTASPGLPALKFGGLNTQLSSDFTPVPAGKIGNFYAGNMALMAPSANFFPAALPADGHLDLINIEGDVGRLAAIKSFLEVENGKFFENPIVKYQKISGYRIKPLGNWRGHIAIDGESVPFEEFQAEVHPGLGRTLSRSVTRYEADGVAPRHNVND